MLKISSFGFSIGEIPMTSKATGNFGNLPWMLIQITNYMN